MHLAQVLEEIDFRDRTQSGTHLMARIRRFLQRAELDENEVNILRGILTAVQNRRARRRAESPDERATAAGCIWTTRRPRRSTRPSRSAMSACLTLDGGDFGNPARRTHAGGRAPRARSTPRARRWRRLSARSRTRSFSPPGATESNNLAILGVAPRAGAIAAVTSLRHVSSTRRCSIRAGASSRRASRVTYLTPDRTRASSSPGSSQGRAARRHRAGVDHVCEQ